MRVALDGLDAVAAVRVHHGQIIVQGEQLVEAYFQSFCYPVEINDADVALAPLDAPYGSLAGQGRTKQNEGRSRPFTT